MKVLLKKIIILLQLQCRHEMSFVRNVATRVIFLDGGKILEDGTPREVFGNPKNERVKEFFTKINRMEEPDYSI